MRVSERYKVRVSESYKVGVSERDRKRERYFVKVCVLERETEMVLMCWHQTGLQYKANKDVLKCTKMDKKIFLILFVVATFLPFLVLLRRCTTTLPSSSTRFLKAKDNLLSVC